MVEYKIRLTGLFLFYYKMQPFAKNIDIYLFFVVFCTTFAVPKKGGDGFPIKQQKHGS